MKRYIDEEKTDYVKRYENGEVANKLILETGISKSTFYNWVKLYKNIKSSGNTKYTAKEVLELRATNKKAKEMLELLSLVECSPKSDLQLKLHEMEKYADRYSVYVLCESLNVSRGTYYNHIKRNKRDQKEILKRRERLKVLIKEIFYDSEQRFGSRKIKAILEAKGEIVSPRLIQELMFELDLQPIGMTSKKEYRRLILNAKRENILKGQFTTDAPNKIWCSDYTEFAIEGIRLYVLVIIDLFSRKIVGYKVTPTATTYSLTSTFRKTIKDRNVDCSNLLFHSDQGGQYTSFAFRKLLKELNITQSFSRKGTPTHNSVVESFMGSFKKEEIYRRYINSEAEFKKSVDNYIDFYNNKRPHQSLGYKIPSEYEANFYLKSE